MRLKQKTSKLVSKLAVNNSIATVDSSGGVGSREANMIVSTVCESSTISIPGSYSCYVSNILIRNTVYAAPHHSKVKIMMF